VGCHEVILSAANFIKDAVTRHPVSAMDHPPIIFIGGIMHHHFIQDFP